MRFGAPYMAVWLWIIPGTVIFYILTSRIREKALRRFAGKELLPEISGSFDAGKRRGRNLIVMVSILLLLLGLMRPQWGFRWREVKRKGLDILIALDTSNSMLAEDVLPNRLDRAKLAIRDLVKKLHGDRIGLVVFSGTAFLQCPLTLDYDGFLLSLDDVDVYSIPVGGTSLSNAIYTAIGSYEGGKKKEKILVIITDGEDLEGGMDRAIERAKAADVKIFCVGIGSLNGELVPVTDEKGKKIFLKDPEGNIVRTRLEEGLLQKMALETGGMYVLGTGAEFGLDLIYEEKLSRMEKQELKSRMEKHYFERFQIPLLFAILLLFIEPLIGDRKRGVSFWAKNRGVYNRRVPGTSANGR
ncbi:MAG: VWA domain-containing protein [Candidatus Omnitrophota bacterium]|nr:VWA domain-containing protein [Candidatus Omnitrophota bacterium]